MADDVDHVDERSMRERMQAGEDYITDDGLHRESVRARQLTHAIDRADPGDAAGLRALLTELLASYGHDSDIRPPIRVDYGWNTYVGDRVFVNVGLVCLDVARVEIGDDCQLGPNVQLLTPTHPLDPQRRRDKWESARPIALGRNVWLGGGVVVCPGVTIGDDTVVGAGAVVTGDLPSGVLAVGNPARVVREL